MLKEIYKNIFIKKKMASARHIIMHYHIFKNAGSTVSSILINNYGGDQCGDIENKNSWGTLNQNDILNYATNNPTLKAISSHHARLPTPTYKNIIFHPIIFLRHPIDRIGSVYFYERKQPFNPSQPGTKIAHENDFAGYVKIRLSDGSAPIRNFQTVHLAGRHHDMRNAIATDDDLKVAMGRISDLPFFGIVELFDESIVKLSRYLSPNFYFNGDNYVKANVNLESSNTLAERLDNIKNMLGQSLYQELLEKNVLDMQLYEQARKLFASSNTR